ncbi:MAG: hypothetical protein KKB04_05650, partial [Candidatus Thermoplasmatota archaeon]|nr:hypothetical protein [Candidatus Thermoplasmatota archaeon]
MSGKKIESLLLVAILVMGAFWMVALGTAGEGKSIKHISGAVYPISSDPSSFANATFYTPNTDQEGAGKYDIQ